MDELEKALKAALQREPAPGGFHDQVLLKANLRSARVPAWWRMPLVRWSIAGVVGVACVAGGVSEYRKQERMRGEQARKQVLMALRITSAKLRVVQSQVGRTNYQGGSH